MHWDESAPGWLVHVAAAVMLGVLLAAADTTRAPSPSGPYAAEGRNAYFVLVPGYRQVFEGVEDGRPTRVVSTVLLETERVDGVVTRVVEERETANGRVVERSRNYFVIDRRTGDALYFGEDVDTYRNGRLTGHEGSWRVGDHGATHGIMMPAAPKVGARFREENAPDRAMDAARIVSTSKSVTVPAGRFARCVEIEETTSLEPGVVEHKTYAPHVGLVVDGGLRLVSFGVAQ